MRSFLAGVILTLIAFPIAVGWYAGSSHMPVAAADPPIMFERKLAKMALHGRISREAPKRDAASFNGPDLASGAGIYVKDCAFCHGLPGQPPSVPGKGMFPEAPQLFEPKEMVTDDPVGVTFWKVQNGIRLTGMPGFKNALSEAQMWQVSGLLARADQLPAEAMEALNKTATPVAVPAVPSGSPASTPANPR
jgi:thiosulfate dehydrogenase